VVEDSIGRAQTAREPGLSTHCTKARPIVRSETGGAGGAGVAAAAFGHGAVESGGRTFYLMVQSA